VTTKDPSFLRGNAQPLDPKGPFFPAYDQGWILDLKSKRIERRDGDREHPKFDQPVERSVLEAQTGRFLFSFKDNKTTDREDLVFGGSRFTK
jgi:hypothetical protein